VQRLDTNTMEWTQLPPSQEYPLEVSHSCAAPLGSSGIIVVGGWTRESGEDVDKYSSVVYGIDTDNLEYGWVRLPDLNLGRSNHDCVGVRSWIPEDKCVEEYICSCQMVAFW